MNYNLYSDIIYTIINHEGLSRECLLLLKEKFPSVQHGTLCSILSLEYQKKMRMNHVKSPGIINKYHSLYETRQKAGAKPGIIVNIAREFDVSPCLVAKLIMQRHYDTETSKVSNNCLNKYLRDTSLIQDVDLAYEVYLCTLYDDQYSPIVETMRGSIGQQHEIQLYRQLSELNLAFRDEEYLRKLGYDKTPDVKLDIPIAIDGFIINWIESKALFGDEEAHRDYTKNQYSSYWNRFGPGLVIYWYGYLETIVTPADKRFIIHDHFPVKNIVQICNKNISILNDTL